MHTLRQRIAHRAYCLPAAAAAACSALARALPPLPALALGTGAAAAAAALSAAALSRCSALPTSLRAAAALSRCSALPTSLRAAAAPLQASASGAAAAARGLPAALLAGAGWRETPRAEAAAACEALLRTAVGTPFTTYTLGGLYTVELAAPRAGAPVLVMLSGYSSGAGLFYPSLDRLAQHYHVHCVDVLGTGASERPPFTAQTAEEGEAFFLHALEQWRALRFPAPPSTGSSSSSSTSTSSTSSSPPLTLLGHSLGGYLAAAYALRHPQAVAHLILVNAAGIPAQADGRIAAARARHWVVGALGWAWEAGVTPGALVRALGPAGSTLVEGIVQRRFAGATPPELARYVHAIMSAQGSGEYALSRLLNFGAHAKAPLGPRLLEGWRGKTTVLHGARDWMDLRASSALVGGLRERGVDAAFVTVAGAEHYVFMERPEAFAAALVQRG